MSSTRRAFLSLFGRSAAVAAVATPVTVAAAVQAVPALAPVVAAVTPQALTPAVRPGVLELGAKADAAAAAFDKALMRFFEAKNVAQSLCPKAPEEIRIQRGDMPYFQHCSEELRDVDDGHLPLPHWKDKNGKSWCAPPTRVFVSGLMKRALSEGSLTINRRTKLGKRLTSILAAAETYERQRAEAIAVADLADAQEQLYWAEDAVRRVVYEAGEIRPASMAEVMIFAGIFSTCRKAEGCSKTYSMPGGWTASQLGGAIAESLLAFGEAAP